MDNAQKNPQKDFKFTGNWSNTSLALQEKYAQLTSEDLEFTAGQEEELITRLEMRLNKKREEVINILNKGMQSAS